MYQKSPIFYSIVLRRVIHTSVTGKKCEMKTEKLIVICVTSDNFECDAISNSILFDIFLLFDFAQPETEAMETVRSLFLFYGTKRCSWHSKSKYLHIKMYAKQCGHSNSSSNSGGGAFIRFQVVNVLVPFGVVCACVRAGGRFMMVAFSWGNFNQNWPLAFELNPLFVP